MKRLFPFILICFLFSNCDEVVFTPKPRGFPKVEYPDKGYQKFDEDFCKMSFEYPTYAIINQDKDFFDEEPTHPCWFDIYIPNFDSRIYCSYVPIDKENTFDQLREDAFKMSDWHLKKATYKEEIPFRKTNNVKGLIFEVEGPVASHLQFYVTDSLEQEHFFRGALYFNTQAKPDSLAPIYKFVKEDIEKMLESFDWGE